MAKFDVKIVTSAARNITVEAENKIEAKRLADEKFDEEKHLSSFDIGDFWTYDVHEINEENEEN